MALPDSIRSRLRLPAVVAPMFLVSGPALAIAGCGAGLIGTLTRNNCRSTEEFVAQLLAVQEGIARLREAQPERVPGPLAANVSIGMPPAERSAALAACHRYGAEIVITAGGDPTPVATEVHDHGGLIFHDVTSIRFAEKAARAGVDGVIAIGAGGGGHSGSISHLALVPQIRAIFDGVIVMAGAVATGAGIRAAEILGADLAYLGTRFIATRESLAPGEYKQLLVSETASDLLYTDAVNGVPAMWLRESMRRLGLDPEHLPPRTAGRGSDHLPAHVKPWKNLWSAGHGIGLIDDIPSVADLVERLREQYYAACDVQPWPRVEDRR